MAALQLNPEPGVPEPLEDLSLYFDRIFFRHDVSDVRRVVTADVLDKTCVSTQTAVRPLRSPTAEPQD